MYIFLVVAVVMIRVGLKEQEEVAVEVLVGKQEIRLQEEVI